METTGATTGSSLNVLCGDLAELCSRHPLREKWLFAPNLRTGYQWIESVARAGTPVLNLRVKTMLSAALEAASPLMKERGLSFLKREQVTVLVFILFRRLADRGKGYLASLAPTIPLARRLGSTLLELRLAGIEDLAGREWLPGSDEKREELDVLLREYGRMLRKNGLVDTPEAFRLAAEAVGTRGVEGIFPAETLFLLPREMQEGMSRREREFWLSLPRERRRLLRDDSAGGEREMRGDLSLLRFLQDPSRAPLPRADGGVEIFSAVGEVNEVREILRRCLSRRIPLDQVELVYTDSSTYPSLVHEELCRLFPDRDELPATFHEGLPVLASRPGRAVAGWLSWIRRDFDLSTLAEMIEDELLDVGGDVSPSLLAAVLRSLPVAGGGERYLPALEARLSSLARENTPLTDLEEPGEGPPGFVETEAEALHILSSVVSKLLSLSSGPGDPRSFLRSALLFLEEAAACRGPLDEYALRSLQESLEEMDSFLARTGLEDIDAPSWLEDRIRSLRIMGEGPRPGRLHVAPLPLGGHSGRPHVFLVGMDEERFPGSFLQDPFLLDDEREVLSSDLPTSRRLRVRKRRDLVSFFSRLRGSITISYPRRDIAGDRVLLPSGTLFSAWRIITGKREGLLEEMIKDLSPPAGFDPGTEDRCLDETDWWIRRLLAGRASDDTELLRRRYPHLERGGEAARNRESGRFTVHDGFVPRAGRDLDPTRPGGTVLSARRLEMLATCPLAYFLRYVLETAPPEEFLPDPYRWLTPSESGSLLHDVFRKFLRRLMREGRRPSAEEGQAALINEILDEELRKREAVKPCPSPEIRKREEEELRTACLVFLMEEEKLDWEGRRLLFLELVAGLPPVGEGNEADSPHPATVRLPNGLTFRLRGAVDRVDLVKADGKEGLVLCDYKTGSSRRFDPSDPFRQGRFLQGVLYPLIVDHCTSSLQEVPPVLSFAYFFPGRREHGTRLEWRVSRLEEGLRILENLVEMLRRGCFPFTDDHDDVEDARYRPFLAAFGDPRRTARQVKRKLCEAENVDLQPFRALRGYEK